MRVLSYDEQTINSSNPLARYAHRSRMKKSVALALSRYKGGLILDYGCGPGVFISEMRKHLSGAAYGYEPFMMERSASGLPIYRSIDEACHLGKFSMVTLFETIEHLSQDEFVEFMTTCDRVLDSDGGILMSGPIEIGPVLFLKEMNRSVLRRRMPEHGFIELMKASVLGIPARRAASIKSSHKGFDFRQAVASIRELGWNVDILHFGPLPIRTWYGNSQFYLWVSRCK
jgi:2-polyprenyl-3-methyl-5-hydroxy-6-metoxy-1,4-benzoquinol methylase